MRPEEFDQQIHHIFRIESRYFADMSSASAASIMNGFLVRSQEDKEPSKWLWEREITENGIVYKYKSGW